MWSERQSSLFKNQCADKGFSIAEGRRICEHQFALSCPPRPPRLLGAGSQGPISKHKRLPVLAAICDKCSSHCGGPSNSACPNTSAGGRFIAKEPPRLGG